MSLLKQLRILPKRPQFLSQIRFSFSSERILDNSSKPTLQIDPYQNAAKFKRPIAPHLTIYQPQLTWVLSGFFRFTGGSLATLFYGGAVWYAVAPYASLDVVTALHSVPWALLVLGKLAIGFPLFFHVFNGLRHLGVYTTGYTVLGLTGISTLIFALFY